MTGRALTCLMLSWWAVVAGAPAGAAVVSLPADAGAPPGQPASADVSIDAAAGVLGTDLVLRFDPAVAGAISVSKTPLSDPHTLIANLSAPGVVRISLFGTTPLAGSGALLSIGFRTTGPAGSGTALRFEKVSLNEGGIPATGADGYYCVDGPPEEVQDLDLDAAPGLPATALLRWAPVSFEASYNVYRGSLGSLSDLSCHLPGVPGTQTPDDGLGPPPGGVFYYLVTARGCSAEGSAGTSSSGTERVIPAPC